MIVCPRPSVYPVVFRKRPCALVRTPIQSLISKSQSYGCMSTFTFELANNHSPLVPVIPCRPIAHLIV